MKTILESQIKNFIANEIEIGVKFIPYKDLKTQYTSYISINGKEYILHTQKGHIRHFSPTSALKWTRKLGLKGNIVFESNSN